MSNNRYLGRLEISTQMLIESRHDALALKAFKVAQRAKLEALIPSEKVRKMLPAESLDHLVRTLK